MLVNTAPDTVKECIKTEGPDEVQEVQKSTIVKSQRRQNVVLRRVGTKYTVTVA